MSALESDELILRAAHPGDLSTLRRCFASPEVTAILIDPLASNLRAHRFYQRLRFELVGPRRFDTDDCLVFRLERESWERKNRGTAAASDI